MLLITSGPQMKVKNLHIFVSYGGAADVASYFYHFCAGPPSA
jgi:hypothetical protein